MGKPLQFREESFDFGVVAEDGGPVNHEFSFTNNSGRHVKIIAVKPSCGCTTPDWSKEPVAPGKTGFIQASFNPKGRPGYFNKSLTVTTDLDANPVVLHIKGHVGSSGKPNELEFRASKGNWKLRAASFNMGKVFLKDEFVLKEFPVYNGGEKPVAYTGKYVGPEYINVMVEPSTLAPGEQGVVKIGYNGKRKNAYGFQSDNVEIHTDDVVNPVKSFSVYATLEDFFPSLSSEELSKAPQLVLPENSIDFGRIKQKEASVREINFTNAGKRELELRSLQGNCTCVTASAAQSKLKPGETSTLKISFNPQERKGTQQKAVTIYSNDPRQPVQRIIFSAYVED
jgi:hypothetical protein